MSALDLGFISVLLLLDFSAAFDCVDHTILLQILQMQFGISASALLWINSFLTQLYIKLSTADLETSKAKLIACFQGYPFVVCVHALEVKHDLN